MTSLPRRQFLSLCIALAVAPAYAAKSASSLASPLQSYVDKQELAGAVTLVANREKILNLGSVGYADVEAKKPMTDDSIFWIASMTKPMTGAALMMLVDEGKIQLDDPVEKYLPEFKGQQVAIMKDGKQVGQKAPARPITIRDVLSHSSGLPFKSPEEAPTLDAMPLEKAVKTYAAQALIFEPGKDFLYSNAGINTAARILEVVTSSSYEAFMDERFFKPLGMKDTTFWPNEKQFERLAKSYKPSKDNKSLEELQIGQLHYPLSDRSMRYPMPAGGLFSTAADVAIFGQMVLNGGEWLGRRYLSKEAVEQMTRKQTAPEIERSYGLGWAVDADGAGHGGAFATNLSVDKKRGLVLVYMVQHSGFPGDGKKAQGSFRIEAIKAFGGK